MELELLTPSKKLDSNIFTRIFEAEFDLYTVISEFIIRKCQAIEKKVLLKAHLKKMTNMFIRLRYASSDEIEISQGKEKDQNVKDYLKAFSIFLIHLNFFAMDEEMKQCGGKLKDLIENFIELFPFVNPSLLADSISLTTLGKKKKRFDKLHSPTMQTSSNFAQILKCASRACFHMRNSYSLIQKAVSQLIDKMSVLTLEQALTLVLDTVLFNVIHKDSLKSVSKISLFENTTVLLPSPPFITEPSSKPLTLVLDLDETLVHNLTVRMLINSS